jgi:REP element-mobilizing transposase RayT
MKQLNLLPQVRPYFGGALEMSPRKSIRPLSLRNPTHLVLKAKLCFNLFKNKAHIQKIIMKQSKTFGVKVYGISIQRDHIHLNLKIFSRRMYKGFIRAVTGLIARKLKAKGIWKLRPFTRIVSWGKDFQILKTYILQNELEVRGLIPKQLRRSKYKIKPS